MAPTTIVGSPARFGLLVGVAGALLLPLPLEAHPGHSRSSRLLKLELADDPPRLTYGLVFEPAASVATRKQADLNKDGAVNAGEIQAELERWSATLREQIRVCQGGSLAALSCAPLGPAALLSRQAVGLGDPLAKTVALSVEFALNVSNAERALRIEDGSFRPEVDRTDVLIEPPVDDELVAAGKGAAGDQLARELKWTDDRPGEVRSFFVAWKSPPPRWIVALVVGAAAAFALLQLVLSRRRQRDVVGATLPKRS